jgi:hypothetical protein
VSSWGGAAHRSFAHQSLSQKERNSHLDLSLGSKRGESVYWLVLVSLGLLSLPSEDRHEDAIEPVVLEKEHSAVRDTEEW